MRWEVLLLRISPQADVSPDIAGAAGVRGLGCAMKGTELAKQDSSGGALTEFEPRKTRMMVAGLSGAIKQARAMRDWAAGEKAIEKLIALQAAFVAWWDQAVTSGKGGDPKTRQSRQNRTLAVGDALAETGITKQQVSRWRDRLKDREAYRLALRKALQTVAMSRDPGFDPVGEISAIEGKYDCIVIDPPWPMQKIERVVAPNQTSEQVSFDYPTMAEAELIAFGDDVLKAILAEDCHIFLWTTQKFIPMALRLLEKWGLHYVLTMVWHKTGGFQPFGLPQYNCEFVIYARRGSPRFIGSKNFFCCFEGQRREHSRKPDEFYETIRRVTDARRLDMFSRGEHEGFDQWGNQTRKFA